MSKRYEKIIFLGEGTVRFIKTKLKCKHTQELFVFQFATVYKARDLTSREIVAVKKV